MVFFNIPYIGYKCEKHYTKKNIFLFLHLRTLFSYVFYLKFKIYFYLYFFLDKKDSYMKLMPF